MVKQGGRLDIIMLWAACCMAFFYFFRTGELTSHTADGWSPGHSVLVENLSVNSVHDLSIIKIHLRMSKTDQYGKGVNIYLGRTGSDILCPVLALLAPWGIINQAHFSSWKMDGSWQKIFSLLKWGRRCKFWAKTSLRCGPQLQDWSCNKGGGAWYWRFGDKDAGMVGSSAYQLYVRASQHFLVSIPPHTGNDWSGVMRLSCY